MHTYQCCGCQFMSIPCKLITCDDGVLFPDTCPMTGINYVFIELCGEEEGMK